MMTETQTLVAQSLFSMWLDLQLEALKRMDEGAAVARRMWVYKTAQNITKEFRLPFTSWQQERILNT